MGDMLKKIGILTYNVKHRKTYDTLCLLKARGYSEVCVYAQPMHYKKSFTPYISHRPVLNMEIPDPVEVCKNFGYSYEEGILDELNIPAEMPLLVCGAGIIPEQFVKEHTIINSHPGMIPFSRGLDSFKWAIWEDKPIGVTTHLIGEYVDGGEIIDQKQIEIDEGDTFFEVAMQVYETEIDMLVTALEKLNEEHRFVNPEEYVVHKRMPHDIESHLLEKFEDYKKIANGKIKNIAGYNESLGGYS